MLGSLDLFLYMLLDLFISQFQTLKSSSIWYSIFPTFSLHYLNISFSLSLVRVDLPPPTSWLVLTSLVLHSPLTSVDLLTCQSLISLYQDCYLHFFLLLFSSFCSLICIKMKTKRMCEGFFFLWLSPSKIG